MRSILLVFALSSVGCVSAPRVGEVSHASEPLAVAMERGCGSEASDALTLRGAELNGASLLLDVRHGGGCTEHTYRVCGAREVLETDPGQWVVTVLRDGHGDACRAPVQRTLEVELAPHRPVDVSTLRERSVTVWVQ